MEIKAYTAIQNLLAGSKETAQSAKTTATGSDSAKSTTEESAKSDKVTISEASKLASLKDLLGYSTSSTRLTRQSILDASASQETTLNSKLATLCTELGIPSGTSLSISTDSEGNFKVAGAGDKNKALAAKLNADDDFAEAYLRLEANQRFIDLPGEIMSSARNSLIDYLDGSGNQAFEQQLSAYTSYQQAPDSFTAMLMMSSASTSSFSFDYEA